MNRIKSIITAIILAILLFINVSVGRKTEESEEDEPPEQALVPYDDSSEVCEITSKALLAQDRRKQDDVRAVIAEIKAEEERAKALAEAKAVKKQKAKRKKQAQIAQASPPSRSSGYVGQAQTYEATHYTAFCPTGCTGVTASGYDVSSTVYYEGMRILAAPKHVPFYSIVRVTYADGTQFDGIVLDRGGDIGVGRLDVLVETQQEAYVLGRQSVEVRMIRKGR